MQTPARSPGNRSKLQIIQSRRSARQAQICVLGGAATGSRWLLGAAASLGLAATFATQTSCATGPLGATDESLAKARSRTPSGAALFEQSCAGCHGRRGESVSRAPRIIGEGALPEYPPERNLNSDPAAGDPELLRLRARTRPAGAPWRDPFRTAQDLYRYVSTIMPLPADKVGSLSPDQYWSIINFMLLAHGVALPPEGVTPSNASTVKL